MKLPIYFDYQATTPVAPEVLQAMLPYFSERFGNAASKTHEFGWTAEAAVEKARDQVAQLLGASECEIVFTSGSTESINLALQGVAHAYSSKGRHLITSAIEHNAVLDTGRALARQGCEITILPVNSQGLINLDHLRAAIRPDTVLISIMMANNEVGTLQPLADIGRIAKKQGVLFHTDATQGVSKMPFHVDELGVDLVSISAHKMYGPKGVGALYIRRKNPRVTIEPLIFGGGHEHGVRSGTLNVPGIVGLGAAAELARKRRDEDFRHTARLRDRMKEGLQKGLSGVQVHGHPTLRLPDNLSVGFEGVDAQALMLSIREIAVSGGSACKSANPEPSHVLKAMGVSAELARGTLRISFGRSTTDDEVDYAIIKIIEKVKEFRRLQEP